MGDFSASRSAKCAKVSVSGMTVTRAIVLPPALLDAIEVRL